MTAPTPHLVCRACKADNPPGARYCEKCGAALPRPPAAEVDSIGLNPPPEELALAVVPLDEREVARDFESEAEAELAAGYLRANGLAAEVAKQMIPGLNFELAVWVRRADLDAARRLLDAADRRARGPQLADDKPADS